MKEQEILQTIATFKNLGTFYKSHPHFLKRMFPVDTEQGTTQITYEQVLQEMEDRTEIGLAYIRAFKRAYKRISEIRARNRRRLSRSSSLEDGSF